MTTAVNLALFKPATQSSLSAYSRGETLEADAALANNGDWDSNVSFHTAEEASPWWEVNLTEVSIVERVYIKNRSEEGHRFCNFTVLHSLDHVHWDVAFTKCDPRQFRNIDIPFSDPIRCQYVRIRLDGRNHLHLCEVAVYGHLEHARSITISQPSKITESAGHPITVFSILFNEGIGFLNLLISNLLHFTGQDEYFVINLSANLPLEIGPLPAISRIRFLRGEERAALGHTLLLGHLETFKWATENLAEFNYFVPISSNSLFLRRFDIGIIEQRLRSGAKEKWYVESNTINVSETGLSLENRDWWWGKVENQPAFLRFVLDKLNTNQLVPMQIEGLLAPADQWGALAALATDLATMGKNLDKDALFPVEEILPATFFSTAYNKNFILICQVLWNPFRTMVRMDQIIQPSWYFPPHIAIAKWFDREVGRPETAAVATLRGRQLVNIISESLNIDDFREVSELCELLRVLTEGLDTLLIKKRGYRPDVWGDTPSFF